MRRINWKTVSTLVALFAVTSCAETTSPSAEPAGSAVAMRFAPEGRPVLSTTTASVDFTVRPEGGLFVVGNNVVVFPRNSICDPATSTYGMGTWDQACTPLSTGIRIHAEARELNGYSWVDFSPSLRFVPSNDPSRYVWLAMLTGGNSEISASTIYFTPSIGGPLIDESLSDPTLRTYVDPSNRLSLRRIKHFTGYGVNSGRTCGGEGQDACADTGIQP
jgi:hypothetical protein